MSDKKRFIGFIIALICVSSNVYSADKIYTTDFSLTEDRISEGGDLWVNGAATGVDWTNVKTSNGNATGTMNRLPDGINLYNDSVAVLKGTWDPDQEVEAVVHSANQTGGGSSGWDGNAYGDCNKEVELILRGSITAHNITLYEIFWSSRKDGTAYFNIGKWAGALADFSYGYLYQSGEGWGNGVTDGDVVKATITGNTIRAYKNGKLIATFTDTFYPFTEGKPGIGFYSTAGCTGTEHNNDFGFKSYIARAPDTRIPKTPAIISVSP